MSLRKPAQLSRRARVVASLLAVFWGYLFFGLDDLLVLVAAPLAAVAFAPAVALPAAAQQVTVAAASVVVGAGLSTSPQHLLTAAGLGATAVGVAALGSGSATPSPLVVGPVLRLPTIRQ